MPHALVIEDDDSVLDAVHDRLRSMGHSHDVACCQKEAEEHLLKTAYDYVLLDLSIPVTYKGYSDREYGRNLLHRIKGPLGHTQTPVIIMTAHDNDSYHLAVELMKEGAVDFVGKPFGEKHPLEKKIREALEKHPPRDAATEEVIPAAKSQTARQPLRQAFLDYYPDRVELAGYELAGSENSTQKRKVLDLLKHKLLTNDRKAYDGNYVAKFALGIVEFGEKAAADAVRQIREAGVKILREKEHLECNGNDIVANRDKGYALGPLIQVRDGGPDAGAEGKRNLTQKQVAALRELRRDKSLTRRMLGRRLDTRLDALDKEMEPLVQEGCVKRTGAGAAMRFELVLDPMEVAHDKPST
jgi:DNA-binding response OmpR family regulator|uniref:response regulator n=1 Tax=Prosthecobacter sp. TaxID=1965333 RepID=UPI00378518E5